MKRLFTSALVLALAIGGAQAQTTSTGKEKGQRKEHKGHRGDHHKKFEQLNLTADQKARLQTLREDYKRQSEELKNNTTLTAEQKKARRKELHEQYKNQSSTIFSPSQKDQIEKMKAERKANGKREGKFGKESRDRSAAMKQELNLSPDQQTKMQQIRTDFRSKFEALRADKSLTQEQKRAKIKELMQAQQAQVKTVLTKEQIEKMESARKERSSRNTK